MNAIDSTWYAIIDAVSLTTSYLAISTWFLIGSFFMFYRYLKKFR